MKPFTLIDVPLPDLRQNEDVGGDLSALRELVLVSGSKATTTVRSICFQHERRFLLRVHDLHSLIDLIMKPLNVFFSIPRAGSGSRLRHTDTVVEACDTTNQNVTLLSHG